MNPNAYLTGLFNESESPLLFIDFDGTISKRDVIDEILNRFATKDWLEIEKLWLAGKIGSRECLRRQFELVKATPDTLDDFIASMEVDEGFPQLLRFCRDARISVHIVSDGFDYYIRRMLNGSLGQLMAECGVTIWANRLLPVDGGSWTTDFPFQRTICQHGCATCKPLVMRSVNESAAPTVFIGDGLSDRFAAKAADVVFAKATLSEFCFRNRLKQTTFSGLAQVADALDSAFEFFITNLYRDRGWPTVAKASSRR